MLLCSYIYGVMIAVLMRLRSMGRVHPGPLLIFKFAGEM